MPQEPHTTDEKVLGIKWNSILDYLCFSVKLDFSPKKNRRHRTTTAKYESITILAQLTKRIILSQVISIYDPLGLVGPFTVRAKMMMRQIWASNNELGWDDQIPEDQKNKWKVFFEDLLEMRHVTFKQYMKPDDANLQPRSPWRTIYGNQSTSSILDYKIIEYG